MQHIVRALARGAYGIEAQQVGFSEINSRENLSQVPAVPGGKIVNSSYFVTLRQNRPSQSRSNKAGNAGYQVCGHKQFIITDCSGMPKSSGNGYLDDVVAGLSLIKLGANGLVHGKKAALVATKSDHG